MSRKAEAFEYVWCLMRGGYRYDLQWIDATNPERYAAIGHREIDRPPIWITQEEYAAWRTLHDRNLPKYRRSYEDYLANVPISRVVDNDDESDLDPFGEDDEGVNEGEDEP